MITISSGWSAPTPVAAAFRLNQPQFDASAQQNALARREPKAIVDSIFIGYGAFSFSKLNFTKKLGTLLRINGEYACPRQRI